MKRSKLFFTSLLAITLGVGAASFGLNAQVSKEADATAAEADIVQYVDTAALSWWSSADAVTRVWEYNDDINVGEYAETTLHKDCIYSFTLKAGKEHFMFRRCDVNTPSSVFNESWAVTYDTGYNFYSFTGESWDSGSNKNRASYDRKYVSKFVSGDTFYVDAQECSSFWHSEGCSTYLYMIEPKGASGETTFTYQMTRIGSSNMYSYELSTTILLTKMVIVRGIGFNGTSWEQPYKYNQSQDIQYTSSNTGSNAFKLGNDYGGTTTTKGMEVFTDAYVADCFGFYFLQQGICLDAGGLSENATTNWSNASSVYTVLKALLINQNYIKTSSSGDLNINRALLRYDTALAKNPTVLTNDFIGRTSGNGRAVTPIVESTTRTSSIITVVIVSVAALTAIGGYFFLRKRKED